MGIKLDAVGGDSMKQNIEEKGGFKCFILTNWLNHCRSLYVISLKLRCTNYWTGHIAMPVVLLQGSFPEVGWGGGG